MRHSYTVINAKLYEWSDVREEWIPVQSEHGLRWNENLLSSHCRAMLSSLAILISKCLVPVIIFGQMMKYLKSQLSFYTHNRAPLSTSTTALNSSKDNLDDIRNQQGVNSTTIFMADFQLSVWPALAAL